MTTTHRKLGAALLVAASSMALATSAFAGEAEDALVAKVVAAYGGDRLTNMRSIRIQDNYKNAFPGQGYTSGYVEFTPLKQDAQLDLAGQRGSVEGWSTNFNFTFNTRTVSVDEDIVAVNYNANTYQPGAGADYYAAYGAVIRVTDTLLAYELSKQTENVEHNGSSTYLGRPHELITFTMPSSPPVTLHVDAESGLISKMTRATGFGALSYQFGNHTTANGVGYASSFEFYVGSDVNILTLSRDISVNNVRSNVFQIDRGIAEEPTRIDTSEMTVDEVSEGVHLAGTGNAYTAFIDAGDHIIGVGGYAGLADRFTAYKEAAGHDKPLRYQIATHHHTDHLGGMADAFALGAIFVTPANAVANVNTAAGEEIPEERIQIIDGKMTLGPVEVYDISTNHAESYALAYIPGAKAAFQADHYNGNYADAPSLAGTSSVSIKNAIDDLNIDVDVLLSAHGRKASSWEDFEAAVAAYDPRPCASGRAICRGVSY